jgi:hypothetical protein
MQINMLIEKHIFYLLSMLLVSSFFLKIIYVFNFTAYAEYVVTDMAGYWNRALHSLEQGDNLTSQWNVWPPLAHITLAWFFKVLSFLGLFEDKLALAMICNVLMSTLSTLWVYLMALKLYPSKLYALLSSSIYAFFFPLVYLNAFILSEHLSLFILLLSIVLLLYAQNRIWIYFLSGVLLAFAIGIRPSFGMIGLVFFVFIFFSEGKFQWYKIKQAIVFTFGYMLVLGMVVMHNNRISHGELMSLSSNGGMNFYMTACQYHKLLTYDHGVEWYVSPPSTMGKPELGIKYENVPLHHQKFYYKKGYECLEDNPISFIKRLKRFENLFTDTMFPSFNSAKYFDELFPFFSKITWYMALLLLLFPLLIYDKKIKNEVVLLFLGTIFAQLIVLFFFNIEQRYLYGFFFAIELLSLLIVFRFIYFIGNHRFVHNAWVFMIIVIGVYIINYYTKGGYIDASKKQITMTLYQDKNNLTNINQKRETIKEFKDKINTINFKTTKGLIHEDLGDFNFKTNVFIDFNVKMNILKSTKYMFLIVSDDGFILKIDSKKIRSFYGARAATLNKEGRFLKKGLHHYRLTYYQGGGPMAVRAYYEVEGKRFLIGEDSAYVEFRQ